LVDIEADITDMQILDINDINSKSIGQSDTEILNHGLHLLFGCSYCRCRLKT